MGCAVVRSVKNVGRCGARGYAQLKFQTTLVPLIERIQRRIIFREPLYGKEFQALEAFMEPDKPRIRVLRRGISVGSAFRKAYQARRGGIFYAGRKDKAGRHPGQLSYPTSRNLFTLLAQRKTGSVVIYMKG